MSNRNLLDCVAVHKMGHQLIRTKMKIVASQISFIEEVTEAIPQFTDGVNSRIVGSTFEILVEEKVDDLGAQLDKCLEGSEF